MQEGERNPGWDSAASAVARHAAISSALDAAENSSEFGEDQGPSAEAFDQHQQAPSPDAGGEPAPSKAEPERPTEGQPADQEADASSDAPPVWPKDRRDWFSTLSDADKARVLDMEKAHNARFTKNTQENADHRKLSSAISEVLKPYESDLQTAGLDHAGAVKWMVQERETFNRDPLGFLLNHAKQANVEPEQLIQSLMKRAGLAQDQLSQGKQPSGQKGNEQGGADPDDWQDPDVLELRALNEALKGEIKALKESFGQFQQSHTQRESMTLQEEVQAFRSAKDDGGNSLRPHYDQLIPIMQQLMNTDPELQKIPDWKAQAKLQAAYDKAIWLHPETRQAAIDAQVNSQVRSQTNQAEVNKAKQAATRRGSPGANGQAQQGAMTRTEAVAAALREFG